MRSINLNGTERHGVLAADHLEENESLSAGHPPLVGQMILDSGCRIAVAGWNWRYSLQESLKEKGIAWKEGLKTRYFDWIWMSGAVAEIFPLSNWDLREGGLVADLRRGRRSCWLPWLGGTLGIGSMESIF